MEEQSQNIRPITEEELRQLPHGAIVAFAARAALRVLPILGGEGNFDYWGMDQNKNILLIERAIHIAIFFSNMNSGLIKFNNISELANKVEIIKTGGNKVVDEVLKVVTVAARTSEKVSPDSEEINKYFASAWSVLLNEIEIDIHPAIRVDYEFLKEMVASKGNLNFKHFYQQPIWPGSTKPQKYAEIENNFFKALKSINYTELFDRYQSGGAAYIDLPLESLDSVDEKVQQKVPRTKLSKTDKEQDNDQDEESGKPQQNLTPAFSIHTHDIAPAFGVLDQAAIIAGLLENFKDEKGQFVGIFGKWGRGKTYFWEKVKENLEGVGKKQYQTVTFHAWKYQDTPASWAYLYEILADTFLNKPKNIFNYRWFFYWTKIIRLSIKRGQWQRPFWAFLFCLAITLLTLLSSVFTSLGNYPFFVWLSLPGIIGTEKLRKKYSTKAIDLFEKFSKKVSFEGYLGSQAEIQKELIILLKTWFPKSDKRKLLLFVDDIDRCEEERIIPIVDALRVMLEDDELKKRLVVVAAVDERILTRAIRKKYYDLIFNRQFEEDADKNKQLESMTREYMDKLFITGIKLPQLSQIELIQYLKNLSEKMNIEKIQTPSFENDSAPLKLNKEVGVENNLSLLDNNPKAKEELKPVKIEAETISEPPPAFDLTNDEIKVLEETITHLSKSATPRQIRIFTYRYMMAARLLSLKKKSSNIDNEEKRLLAMMIFEYGLTKNIDDLDNYKNALLKRRGNNITIKTMDISFVKPKNFIINLFEALEMVVTY